MALTKLTTHGLYTATTSPMTSDGELNTSAIAEQIEFQLQAGIAGIVAVGGTGEASALSFSERVEVVGATVEAVAGRVPVLAGVTTPGLPDTLALGRACLDAGANGLMVITPFGTAPSQAGIRDYYKAVADGLGQAVMLYEIPYLTLVALQPETVCDIVTDGSIFAMKASNPDQASFTRVLELVGDHISVMSGDEHLFALQIALGAVGGVLASTNILPRTWMEIFRTTRAGDLKTAQQQIARIRDFLISVYAEPNPGPMKVAQALAGFDAGPVRLPNKAPSAALVSEMREQLIDLLAYERGVFA